MTLYQNPIYLVFTIPQHLSWPPLTLLAGLLLLALLFVVKIRRTNPQVPGHILAKLTNRHYEYIAATGQMAQHSLKISKSLLHDNNLQYIQPKSISITSPQDIRRVLSSPRFQKSKYYEILRFTSTDSLLSTTDPTQVSRMRRIFGPYFNSTYVSRMEPLILDCGIKRIMQKWDMAIDVNQGRVNYCESFNLATFGIISKLVFGQEIKYRENSVDEMDTVRWMSRATTYMSLRAVLQLLPLWLFKLLTMPWDHYHRDITRYVDESIKQRQESKETKSDLLQALVDSQQQPYNFNNQIPLTRDQVHAESFLLLIGGIDPTAYTMVWTLHLLLLYPDHLNKVQKELRLKYPPSQYPLLTFGGELRGQTLYLEACIYESMRLVPVPCVQIPRTCPMHKVSLQGVEFPKGTTVFANIWGSHHSECNWKDPEVFNPQRFVDDPRAKHSVFAFGHGLRLCMGKQLAMMNMVTILANLLRSYEIRPPHGYTHTGPQVLDSAGIPKLMPMTQFLSAKPKYPERDCQLVIRRYEDEQNQN